MPFFFRSSSWVPDSLMNPSSITRIWSAIFLRSLLQWQCVASVHPTTSHRVLQLLFHSHPSSLRSDILFHPLYPLTVFLYNLQQKLSLSEEIYYNGLVDQPVSIQAIRRRKWKKTKDSSAYIRKALSMSQRFGSIPIPVSIISGMNAAVPVDSHRFWTTMGKWSSRTTSNNKITHKA